MAATSICFMTNELPVSASCVSDLDLGIYTIANDGIPKRAIVRGGYVIHMHSTHCEYPVGRHEVVGGFPKEGGLFGIGGTKNKRVYATLAEPYDSVKQMNGIMDVKFEGIDMYDHFSNPTKVGSDRVMAEIRIEKDRGLIKVQLTERSLDNRQGR